MGTSLSDVVDLFTMLVNDHRLNALYEQSVTNFNTYMEGWLKFAVVEFSPICTQDLSYSSSSQTFSETLTSQHQTILARIMTKYWLQKVVQDTLQMNVNIQDHDFKTFSQAQNLDAKERLLQEKKEEISQMLQDYSYNDSVNAWTDWEDQIFTTN